MMMKTKMGYNLDREVDGKGEMDVQKVNTEQEMDNHNFLACSPAVWPALCIC